MGYSLAGAADVYYAPCAYCSEFLIWTTMLLIGME
jgi:hypothetical protein